MNLAFLDLRVIESSAFIAAPLAGLTLAQFGADVIRVEMIGGSIDYGRLPLMPSGRSLYWTSLNKANNWLRVFSKVGNSTSKGELWMGGWERRSG